MRRRLGRILDYWRAERRTIRQGLVALVVATAGSLVAGIFLSSITGTLERVPGLMVLIPAAVATRGNIFGALGSRLGTTIHAGLFEAAWRRGGVLSQNIYAATVLTFSVSLAAALLARALSVAFGIDTISVLDFVVISILGGVLASVFVGAFAAALAVRAFRGGWDLDGVAAPLITAAGDMFTIPALFVASLALGFPGLVTGGAVVFVVVATVLTIMGLLSRQELAGRVIKESLPILVVAAGVDIFAGIVVESRLVGFTSLPVLLMIVPPILGNAGGLGGLLSSRLTSKLHLGVITPRGRPEAVASLDFSIVFLIGVAIFPVLGVAASVTAGALGQAGPAIVTVVGISLMAGMMATILASVVAYYAAVATFRMGLDPDNHGIPMITSSMDLVGVVCIVLAILAFGVA